MSGRLGEFSRKELSTGGQAINSTGAPLDLPILTIKGSRTLQEKKTWKRHAKRQRQSKFVKGSFRKSFLLFFATRTSLEKGKHLKMSTLSSEKAVNSKEHHCRIFFSAHGSATSEVKVMKYFQSTHFCIFYPHIFVFCLFVCRTFLHPSWDFL